MTLRQWNVESEIKLLSLICDFKPAGGLKQKNIALILENINEGTEQKFTQDQIEAKLDTLFDMNSVDKIEQDIKQEYHESNHQQEPENADEVEVEDKVKVEDLADDLEERLTKAKTRTSVVEKRPRRGARVAATRSLVLKARKGASGSTVTPELSDEYSSELSDVEGEEVVIAKLQDKESTGDANLRKTSGKSNLRKKDSKEIKKAKDLKDTLKSTKDKKQKTGSLIEESKSANDVDVESSEKDEESAQATEQTPEVKTPVESTELPVLRKRTRANAKLDNADELPAKKQARILVKKGVKKEPTPDEAESIKAESPEAEDEPKKRRSSRQTARRNSRRN